MPVSEKNQPEYQTEVAGWTTPVDESRKRTEEAFRDLSPYASDAQIRAAFERAGWTVSWPDECAEPI